MRLLRTTLAVATLAAACACLAAPAYAESAVMTAGHEARVSKLVGTAVYNAQNEKIGTLDDVLIPAAGGPASAVISVGDYVGGGDKQVLIPLSRVRFRGDTPVMSATKAQLASMKAYTFHMAADSAG